MFRMDQTLILKVFKKASQMHQDILLGNFTDTYHTLTIRSPFGLQWALKFCPEMKNVMKTYDVVYFNLPNSGLQDKAVHMLDSLNVNSQISKNITSLLGALLLRVWLCHVSGDPAFTIDSCKQGGHV